MLAASRKTNCDDPEVFDLRMMSIDNSLPSDYRYVYIDELLYNEELRQLVLDKVGRFELAYVINGSIYGTRVGNSIN